MIVLAIVIIAAAIAAPSFAQFIKQDRIVTSANRVHSIVKFARSEAVKRETPMLLRVNGTNWEVVENAGELDEAIINLFTQTQPSVSLDLVNLTIAPTGEFNAAIDIGITDGDATTTNYRLCGLISGQTWIEQGVAECP